MCGRFALNEDPVKLAKQFMLSDGVDFAPAWNIAPSLKICSITADDSESRHLQLMKWGLIPSWAKDAAIGYKLSNARGETVAEKPSFRSAFKHHRCIIPASGFYEWKTEKGVKQPWYISLKSGEPLAFAGLWETWHDIQTCCIITTSANSLMAPIHIRMPVILDQSQWATWLSPNERLPDRLLPAIQPFDPDLMQAWPVTRELNKVGLRNDAGLIESIA
ncbi:MAG: SOS response-associated peptidase [Gallionella sp.]